MGRDKIGLHMMTLRVIKATLKRLGNVKTAKVLQGFFKTGPGEYGEGDIFLGIKVPVLRKLGREIQHASFRIIESLLKSPIHEERLLALLLLVQRYSAGSVTERRRIFRFYLENTRRINNWDLVDLTAPRIVGAHLADKNKRILRNLARSGSLWERRIAIVSTFHFIRQGRFSDTLGIAGILLDDQEDLIHKAVGWMLREVGKRNLPIEEDFLKTHCKTMPRTMLRYAIERFPESKRRRYLSGIAAV
jgi:3-methyladenine DNA glycosylase AlkD